MGQKLVDAADAARRVSQGASVGLGGMLLSRRPVALCRALARAEAADLTLVGVSGGFETDALVGLGAVREVRISFLSLGVFGLAPMFTEAVQAGQLSVPFETEMSVAAGVRAAAARLGFQPGQAWHGTEYGSRRADVAMVTCPYTGQRYVAFPRIDLDVALIHAPYADSQGNAVLGSDLVLDREMARAAALTILSAERILSTEALLTHAQADLIAADVDLVVEAPSGAWPSACVPDYDADGAFLVEYLERCKAGEGRQVLDDWLKGRVGPAELAGAHEPDNAARAGARAARSP